jgi:predicted RNA-binding protein YlqC (UPF0109 family)
MCRFSHSSLFVPEPLAKQQKVDVETTEDGGKNDEPTEVVEDPSKDEAAKAKSEESPPTFSDSTIEKEADAKEDSKPSPAPAPDTGENGKAPEAVKPKDTPTPSALTEASKPPAAQPTQAPAAPAPAVPRYAPPAAASRQAAPGHFGAGADQIVEEQGEVSALYVGRVIGKGGEMIRDLQARSSCRIDVDQNVPAGQPRVITYRGTRRTVDFAKHLVQMLCQENAAETDLPLGEAKREFLVVPSQSVGKIIGRGGEMIRELQSRSQAKIQVDHSGNSGLDHSEKRVTITGTDQAVTKAREMVLFLVANPMMDAMQAINMLIEDKVHRGGIWGSGPPYPNLPSQVRYLVRVKAC